MKRSSLKRSTKPLKRSPMKRGKRLKAKRTGRSPLAAAYAKEHQKCEICPWLDGDLWLRWCELDGRACTETSPKHVHHVYAVASRWDSADGANYITCCERSHGFLERYPYYGRLVCTWAKIENGTFNRQTVIDEWDRDPVSVIHGDVDAGRMEAGTDWEDLWKLVSEHF